MAEPYLLSAQYTAKSQCSLGAGVITVKQTGKVSCLTRLYLENVGRGSCHTQEINAQTNKHNFTLRWAMQLITGLRDW